MEHNSTDYRKADENFVYHERYHVEKKHVCWRAQQAEVSIAKSNQPQKESHLELTGRKVIQFLEVTCI